ncbi:DUF4384 domain-containing protein [Dasania sp. GY-MA-18]|uniref:DUF4384 domain-containing protein n=1 Tax=Dasania phycosphaerae TaxID=2950436 RepID=A0A9J6RNA4_9GAMM|nr:MULTISPECIES: DUF4384 domain-containing protein [Dasania]MCR8923361.1 DUF4384 domain-containing protein [Dasania sp. GY-MA-18]MCZ0865793.1 DUF4384 domain-containing protein [Dasania phycosphaerae]MCZ0869518.1 DUF4384 domain-containing protein [Dasania phycosphaerae]
MMMFSRITSHNRPSFSKALISLILILACHSLSQARTLSAQAYGSDEASAKNAALSALASSIFVQIESSSTLQEDSSGASNFSSSSHSSSNLPMIGVELDCYPSPEGQLCQANMDSQVASGLYHAKTQQLAQQIQQQYAALANIPRTQHYPQLLKLLADYQRYEQFATVLLYLSPQNHPAPISISPQQLKLQLAQLEAAAPSLSLAAKLLTKGITQGQVYAQPATLKHSREITPFAAALLTEINQRLARANNLEQARYIFNGEYQINDQGISVNYTLSDTQGNIISSRLAQLAPSSYQHLATKPIAPDFDRLLHAGYAVASDFNVQVATNKGQRQLLFVDGEEIEILIKVNKPGYFYVVGHTKNGQNELSYLIDINEAQGDRRFVYYVNADEVNKWVSIGSFIVSPPYGVESLQVIASRSDMVNQLPSYNYEPSSEYYVLSHNINQAVMQTRGLKKKKTSSQELSTATEAVLLFTTQRR